MEIIFAEMLIVLMKLGRQEKMVKAGVIMMGALEKEKILWEADTGKECVLREK